MLDEPQKHHEYYMIMNRAALIEQIQEARKTLEKLLTLAANQQLSSATDLFPASISPGEIIGEPVKQPGSPASKSSGAPSRHSRSPGAWALREFSRHPLS